MNEKKQIKFTNYRMAAGRIGLALVLLPILGGLGVLILIDEAGNPIIGAVLLALSLPFIWYAMVVPTSVTVDNKVTVRYALFKRQFERSEIDGVHFGSIGTRYGMGQLTGMNEYGVRRYQTATISTSNKKKICFIVKTADLNVLGSLFKKESSASAKDE